MRLLLLVALIAGALFAPAIDASAQNKRTGIVVRLLEAPEERRDDPRARVYIVDHVPPGTSLKRSIEVTNDTDEAVSLQLYDAAAEIRDGQFTVREGRAENTVTPWITMSPQSAELNPDESVRVEVAIAVPRNAPDGEFYAAALAERPAPEGGQVRIATRVGIRIYLSVGTGVEPVSDFKVESLTGERRPDGRPIVRAQVVNIGGRALDLVGELELRDGPGGAKAGPFLADVATTLAPRARAPVTVLLDPALPAGPWLAVMTVTSGSLQRAARATVTFPAPGGTSPPVSAQQIPVPETASPPVLPGEPNGSTDGGDERSGRGGADDDDEGIPWWILLLALLLLIGLFLFLLFFWRRRKKEEEDDEGEGLAENAP